MPSFTEQCVALHCSICGRAGATANCEVCEIALAAVALPAGLRYMLLTGLATAGWVADTDGDLVCPHCKGS